MEGLLGARCSLGMDARVSRTAWVCVALSGIVVAACTDAPVVHPAVPTVAAKKDDVAWEKAERKKARGLDTPKERSEYVHILADACENGHDPWACIEAARVDKRLGRTLLFHGCSLGERDACAAYVKAEVDNVKRDRVLAMADARQALTFGCASYAGTPCVTLSQWNGESSEANGAPPTSLSSPPYTGPSVRRAHAEDMRIAQAACVLSCTEEQKGCTSRCSKSPGSARDCVFACSNTSLTCAKGCREAAAEACHELRHEDCSVLKGP